MRPSEMRHNLMLTAVIGLILVGVVVVLIINSLISQDESDIEPGTAITESSAVAPGAATATVRQAQPGSLVAMSETTGDVPPFPKVLEGTTPPEGLEVDEQGHLLVTQRFRQLLDYFTQLIGVEGVPHQLALELAQQHFRASLTAPALGEALEILDRYWEYTEYVNGVQMHPDMKEAKAQFDGHYEMDALTSVEKFREERRSIQQALFSPAEIDAFFADEQRYDKFMLEQIRLSQSDMDDEQRQMLLANNQQTLSPEQLDARQETLVIERYKTMMKDGQLHPGMGNWYQAVSQEMGDNMAEKLLQVEKEKQDWSQKKAAYLSRKDELLRAGLSEQDLVHQLDTLMVADLGFSEFELRRMQALEGRLPH